MARACYTRSFRPRASTHRSSIYGVDQTYVRTVPLSVRVAEVRRGRFRRCSSRLTRGARA